MLITWHNLTHYQDLMAGLREAIAGGRLQAHAREALASYATGDIESI